MSAEATREPCADCAEPIKLEADKCPECGNNPARKVKRSGMVLFGVGLFFIWIPVVGAPLAILGALVLLGAWRKDYSPTEQAY